MPLDRRDLYIGKELFCCCGKDCGKYYEVITDVYEKDGERFFEIKEDISEEVKSVNIDFINEYCEY